MALPKTTSESVLQHYPPLREISAEDWDEVFHRQGKAWKSSEDAYLRDWYGRESTMTLAYALGRCPWSVQERARKLGLKWDAKAARRAD